MSDTITITDSAVVFLSKLLEHKADALGVRITVRNGGNHSAETVLSYCKPDDIRDTDQLCVYSGLKVYVDTSQAKYLEDAKIDYDENKHGGSLTIKAPNAYVPKLGDNPTLSERVQYYLDTEVTPTLAAHGGAVSVAKLTEQGDLYLQFSGGCQGCSQVNATLKYSVEEKLAWEFEELRSVNDITDHSDNSGAFFK